MQVSTRHPSQTIVRNSIATMQSLAYSFRSGTYYLGKDGSPKKTLIRIRSTTKTWRLRASDWGASDFLWLTHLLHRHDMPSLFISPTNIALTPTVLPLGGTKDPEWRRDITLDSAGGVPSMDSKLDMWRYIAIYGLRYPFHLEPLTISQEFV